MKAVVVYAFERDGVHVPTWWDGLPKPRDKECHTVGREEMQTGTRMRKKHGSYT